MRFFSGIGIGDLVYDFPRPVEAGKFERPLRVRITRPRMVPLGQQAPQFWELILGRLKAWGGTVRDETLGETWFAFAQTRCDAMALVLASIASDCRLSGRSS